MKWPGVLAVGGLVALGGFLQQGPAFCPLPAQGLVTAGDAAGSGVETSADGCLSMSGGTDVSGRDRRPASRGRACLVVPDPDEAERPRAAAERRSALKTHPRPRS